MKRRGTKPTLRDVAREAGVSPTTVSLVLADQDTRRVSVATRARIMEIAQRISYRPNAVARSLVKNESRTIGFVMTTLLNPFYSEIAQDIIDRAAETGYRVLACSAQSGLEEERLAVHDLLDRGVDGLIISSALRRDTVVEQLSAQRFPFVLVLRTVEQPPGAVPVDFVGVDNRRGAYLVVEHLLKVGHVRLAVISGPLDASTGYDRLAGARAAFESRGVRLAPGMILQGDFGRASGYRATRELLSRPERPTAIFAASDHMAMGVLDALREAGLRAPEDMAVTGFDDIEMAGLPGVDLTTVSQKKATMGRLAVDTLIEKIRGQSSDLAKRIIMDPILVIRRSCGYHALGSAKG